MRTVWQRLMEEDPLAPPEDPPETKPKKIVRNMSTPEARAFWENVEKTAAEVRKWPAWKRGGL